MSNDVSFFLTVSNCRHSRNLLKLLIFMHMVFEINELMRHRLETKNRLS